MSPSTLKAFCCQWNSNGDSDGLVLSNNFAYSKWDAGPKCPAYFQRVQRPTSNIFLILSCISSNEIARTWCFETTSTSISASFPSHFYDFHPYKPGISTGFPPSAGHLGRWTPWRPRTPSQPPCSKVLRRRRATWPRPGLRLPGRWPPSSRTGAFFLRAVPGWAGEIMEEWDKNGI